MVLTEYEKICLLFSKYRAFKHHTCGGLIPSSHNNYYSGGFYIYSFGES